jgi:hypothetical protein
MSKVAVRFDTITEADQERITCHILHVHRQRRASGFLPTLEDTSRGSAASVGGGDATNAEAPAG